jgi:hypothetical protein
MGQVFSASWEAGTQIMIVARGAVVVSDGAYGGFVMKKIGGLDCGAGMLAPGPWNSQWV